MTNPEAWVPFRWPCGPLETALLEAPPAGAEQAHKAWQEPASLSFLKDSPVNCLVVAWSGGKPQDAEQQRVLQPLIAAAHAQGLAVVGRVYKGGAAGAAAGLDAVIVEPGAKTAAGVAVIAAVTAEECEHPGSGPVLALAEAVWPQIPVKEGSPAGGADAGPTGNPWIDSNVWAVDLVRVKAPGKSVWILADPPGENRVWRPEAYVLAVADAGSVGARWPVSLDPAFRLDLAAGKQEALAGWRRIAQAMRFFEGRRAVSAEPVVAKLGVVSDFAAENAFLANEFLNLAARRLLSYRIIDKGRMSAASLNGLAGVIWIDEKAPSGPARRQFDRFVAGGGMLILPASAAEVANGLKPEARQDRAFATYTRGKGRVAVARQPWSDPWVLAAETHMVFSRKHDVIRLYNSGTSMVRYTAGNGRGMLQLVNFAGRSFGHPVSVSISHPYKTARLVTLDQQPRTLEVVSRDSGIELKLPGFVVYGVVELEG